MLGMLFTWEQTLVLRGTSQSNQQHEQQQQQQQHADTVGVALRCADLYQYLNTVPESSRCCSHHAVPSGVLGAGEDTFR
jgi:hypothetical protein